MNNLLPLESVETESAETPDNARPTSIPAEAWEALQEAGHAAAERLRELITARSFERLRPAEQARLIALALDRAYGPPVKREMTLSLSGDVTDAVADSLARLSGADLPETRKSRSR